MSFQSDVEGEVKIAAMGLDDEQAEILLQSTPRTIGSRSRTPWPAIIGSTVFVLVVMASMGDRPVKYRSRLHGVIGLSAIEAVDLPVTVRDFKRSDLPGGHPDMMPSEDVKRGMKKALVKSTLGDDNKPVFNGEVVSVDEGTTHGLTTKANFDQWYRDDNKNKHIGMTLPMTVHDGKLYFEKHGFFPADGKGWKDVESKASICHPSCGGHNYYFTLEMHNNFTYRGGEVFSFKGNDDLWVFINKQLVCDLGGMHDVLEESVKLDDLGLEKDSVNTFHLFFAERHPVDSNFRIETSIRLDETVAIKSEEGTIVCCLFKLSIFSIMCVPEEEKAFYHFMCGEA